VVSKLPVVLDPEEVAEFFDYVPSLMYRAALMLCYGAGLRIGEAEAIKVEDINSKRMLIHVREGKGRKDRGPGAHITRIPAADTRHSACGRRLRCSSG
jgi:integrase